MYRVLPSVDKLVKDLGVGAEFRSTDYTQGADCVLVDFFQTKAARTVPTQTALITNSCKVHYSGLSMGTHNSTKMLMF